MNATMQLSIPLTTNQLADLIRKQLPREEQLRLATMIQEEQEPTKEAVLSSLHEDLTALKNGKLKTRPIRELLNEV